MTIPPPLPNHDGAEFSRAVVEPVVVTVSVAEAAVVPLMLTDVGTVQVGA